MILDPSTMTTKSRDSGAHSLDDGPPPYMSNPSERFNYLAERAPVNQINITTRHEDITGTYFIDPNLSAPTTRMLKKSKRSKRACKSPPNASFRTKKGAIDVNLVVGGNTVGGWEKVSVDLYNRKNDIAVNVMSLQESKHITIEATTRKGDIILLLPRNFCGAIQLRSRGGRMTFLPSFSAGLKVVNSSGGDALLLFGETALGSTASSVADYCKLTACHGKIVVGISGEDRYVPEPGFWKKLGSVLFHGEKISEAPLPPIPTEL